jgi:LPS export ABC transporter protein LptC
MLIIFVFSCSSDLDNMKQLVHIEGDIPDSYYTSFNITYSDSGALKVKITGEILEQYAGTKEVEGKDIMKDSVHIRFYNQLKEVSSELKADYAVRFHASEKMYAKGNVIVINNEGEKLNTEKLLWDAKTKQIICDTTVLITKPSGQKIIGTSLVSDQNFENYQITGITGELPFKREKSPK